MKLKPKNELYSLVDEEFISEFDSSHQDFMKKYITNTIVSLLRP